MVNDMKEMSILRFVHKQVNNKNPEIFQNIYVQNVNTHSHNTRQSLDIHIPRVNSDHGKRMIKFTGAQLWNHLPHRIRKIKNPKTFMTHCKQLTLDKY